VMNLQDSVALAGNYIDATNLAAARNHLEMEASAPFPSWNRSIM
jgi:hypothetical protein